MQTTEALKPTLYRELQQGSSPLPTAENKTNEETVSNVTGSQLTQETPEIEQDTKRLLESKNESDINENQHDNETLAIVPSRENAEPIPFSRSAALKKLLKGMAPLMFSDYFTIGETFYRMKLLSDLGPEALTIDALSNITSGFVMSVDGGIFSPVCSMIGQSHENPEIVGRIVQQGWLLGCLLSIPTVIIIWYTEPILSSIGFQPELMPSVGEYSKIIAFGAPCTYLMIIDGTFLRATSRVNTILPFAVLSSLIGAGVSYLLIPGNLGMAPQGVMGAAYASLLQKLIVWAAFKLYFTRDNYKNYKLYKFSRSNFHHFRKILKFGAPQFVLNLIQQGKNLLIGFMMVGLGPEQLTINIAADRYIPFLAPPSTGIRLITQVYIAQCKGANDIGNLRRYGNLGIVSEVALTTLPLIAYTIFPIQLSSYFLPDEYVDDAETMIRITFAIRAINNVLDAIQGSVSENLKSLLDTFFPAIVQSISSLAIILPLSYVMAFVFGWDLNGMNLAAAIGSLATLPALIYRWNKRSHSTEQTNYIAEIQADEANSQSNLPPQEISDRPRSERQAIEVVRTSQRSFLPLYNSFDSDSIINQLDNEVPAPSKLDQRG